MIGQDGSLGTGMLRARPRVFYGWYIVLASVLLSVWTGGIFYYGFTAFFNPVLEEFGWSRATTAFAFSLQSVESGILAPALGFLIDRLGVRKVVIPGVVVAGAGLLLLSAAHSLVAFYVAFLVTTLGFGTGAGVGAYIAVVNWFQRKRGRALAIISAGFGVSGSLAPLLVWLIGHFGWRGAFAILGIATWALCLPLASVLRHRPQPYGYLPDGEPSPAQAVAQAQVPASSPGSSLEVAGLTARQALRTSAIWLLNLAALLPSVASTAIVVHAIPYFTSVGISREVAALAVSGITLCSLIGRLGFGYLGDFYDRRRLMAISFVLQTLGVLILTQVSRPWHLIPFVLVYGPGYAGSYPLRPALQADYFGLKAFGTIQGFMSIGWMVGGIAGPWSAGWVYDLTGSYYTALVVFALLTLVAAPVALAIRPPRQA